MPDIFDESVLKREYEEVMRQMREPIGGEKSDVLTNVAWGHRWRRVSITTARIANKAIREAMVPAFQGASVSRGPGGQFAPKLKITEQDFPLLVKWFRGLQGGIQRIMRTQWSPLRAPFYGAMRRNASIIVEVNPLEVGHFDVNDKLADIVVTAAGEALVQDAEVWIGPVINDIMSAKPYNRIH